jgi:uncharacterized membrane protein YbaN (DUF454 family)
MKKTILFSIGIFSLILAVIGVFLPVLPTTPFALLSVYCFERSSRKFHDYILSTPVLGESVINWNERRVISKKTKIIALSFISLSLFYVWMFNSLFSVKLLVTLLLLSVSIFILKQKS